MTRNILLALLGGAAVGLLVRYFLKNREASDFIEEAQEEANRLARRGKKVLTDTTEDVGRDIGRMTGRKY